MKKQQKEPIKKDNQPQTRMQKRLREEKEGWRVQQRYERFLERGDWVTELNPEHVDRVIAMLDEVFNMYRELDNLTMREYSACLKANLPVGHKRREDALDAGSETLKKKSSVTFLLQALANFKRKANMLDYYQLPFRDN